MSTKKKCKRDSSRGLDAKIARLLNLDVLGEVPARFNDEDGWYLLPGKSAHKQFVYLEGCNCIDECADEGFFGHLWTCLEVVPFYHQDIDLAVRALEQICDERLLVVDPYRCPIGEWVVELYKATGNQEPIAYGRDESFALAICKALVELEEKQQCKLATRKSMNTGTTL